MCINEYVSISTFFCATIFNYFLVKNFKNSKEILTVAIIWQWVILMQFFEAFVWIGIKNKKKGLNTFGTYGLYIANILQPIVISLCIILLTKQSYTYNLIFTDISVIYLLYCALTYFNKIREQLKNVKNKPNCNNLHYPWWDNMHSGLFYIIFIISLFLLAKPHHIYIPQLLYILFTLLIAIHTQKDCGNSSIWCFMAAFAPLFTLIFHKYVKIIN